MTGDGENTLAEILEAKEDRARARSGPEGQATGSPGQTEDPDLNTRARARFSRVLEARADQLTVAQRLTRRALKETIKIPFEDDLGTFEIEMRIPMSSELDDLVGLRKQIEEAEIAGDKQALDDASTGLYVTLARLATDPSMTAGFFASGALLSSDFARLITSLLQEEQRRVEASARFRQNPGRS